MIWHKIKTNPAEVKEIARQHDLDLISSSILIRRNLTGKESICFLLEDDLNLLHNPFLFKDMEKAVDRVNRALKQGEKIMIFGDRDVDGITSTVLLFQLIGELGGRVDWKLPLGEEDYGLTPQVIESLASDGYSLLIAVDCGISNIEEIALASEKGIETIVLDHHNPQQTLPPALAIINPKLEECGYPFRDLAGCGVAAKFSWALYFSRTALYGKSFWLMHIKPDNETYTVEAVKLINLVERERIVERLLPGPSAAERLKTRLIPLISENGITVYDRESQLRLLKKIQAAEPVFVVKDLQPLLQESLPHLAGKSLLKIKELNRSARCSGPQFGELDMLASLFNTLMLKREQALLSKLDRIMDLVALGTLADLMPLMDENRVIVKKGLEVLNQLNRCGLRELIVKKNLYGKRITTTDIAWRISPVLNSAGRMGEPEKAAELLLSSDPAEAGELADYIEGLNRERKKLGDKAWTSCLARAKESLEKSGGKFVLIYDNKIPRGITGILASRLSNFFKVPCIAVALGEDKAVGSLRSPYPLDGFLDQYADLLSNYGGHDRAAGFSLSSSFMPKFEGRLFNIASELRLPDQREEKLTIDAEVPPAYMNPNLIKVVEFFEPYGEGNPALCFLTRGVRIEALEIIGKLEMSHVKLLLSAGKYRWPAVYWNAAERAGKDFKPADTVDIVYRLARNYFQNTETLQLTILDLKQ
ncbi:hypothetical protein ES703_64342 [subsurface metagenome]